MNIYNKNLIHRPLVAEEEKSKIGEFLNELKETNTDKMNKDKPEEDKQILMDISKTEEKVTILKPEDNSEDNSTLRDYAINRELYQTIITKGNINSHDVFEVNIYGDGNCFYRVLSDFIYGNSSHYEEMRRKISNYGVEHGKEIFDDLEQLYPVNQIYQNGKVVKVPETLMPISNYIQNIKYNSYYAGTPEIKIACHMLRINITIYRSENNSMNDEYFKWIDFVYLDQKVDESKDLLIILHKNENNFNTLYYFEDLNSIMSKSIDDAANEETGKKIRKFLVLIMK